MAMQTVHHTAMTISDHLPILQIIIPFIAAPLIVFIGQRKLAWPIAFFASSTAFVISCLLLSKVIGGGIISYQIGGWAPPLGIEYRVDAANAFVLFPCLAPHVAEVINCQRYFEHCSSFQFIFADGALRRAPKHLVL